MGIVQSGLLSILCAPFVTAIWSAFKHRRELTPTGGDFAQDGVGLTGGFEASTINLEAAVREAATAIGALAGDQRVRCELAVNAAITVHSAPGILGFALRQAMMSAIRASPEGHVLVTAEPLGSQLHIRVTDDGRGDDQGSRESLLRDSAAAIALQGGSIVVDAVPDCGTTVTVRLPMLGPSIDETVNANEFAEEMA